MLHHFYRKKFPGRDYLLIIFGAALMAAAVNSVFDPAGLVTGGFSGIAILVKRLTEGLLPGGVPLWLTNLLLNVPLFFVSLPIKGFSFLKKALTGEAALSLWLLILPAVPLGSGDLFLTSVYGGLMMGAGIGLVLLGKGSTGGTDLAAVLIHRYVRHYSVPRIMLVIDGCIVAAGGALFGVHRAMYAIIAVFLVTKVSDGIVEGLTFAKGVYIISCKPGEIADRLMKELDRGVTGLGGWGMYSGREKTVLFCVLSQRELIRLKELTAEIDEKAFLIVTDAREVMGEGFPKRPL